MEILPSQSARTSCPPRSSQSARVKAGRASHLPQWSSLSPSKGGDRFSFLALGFFFFSSSSSSLLSFSKRVNHHHHHHHYSPIYLSLNYTIIHCLFQRRSPALSNLQTTGTSYISVYTHHPFHPHISVPPPCASDSKRDWRRVCLVSYLPFEALSPHLYTSGFLHDFRFAVDVGTMDHAPAPMRFHLLPFWTLHFYTVPSPLLFSVDALQC